MLYVLLDDISSDNESVYSYGSEMSDEENNNIIEGEAEMEIAVLPVPDAVNQDLG